MTPATLDLRPLFPAIVVAITGIAVLLAQEYGVQSIPSRWLTYVHGQVRGVDGTLRHYDHLALQALAVSLLGEPVPGESIDDLVPQTPRRREINVALSNSFGFGGTNASVIMQRVAN